MPYHFNTLAVSNPGEAMPFEYTEIDDPDLQEFVMVKTTDYAKVPITLPNWKPEPCSFIAGYLKLAQQVKDMVVRPDDVWLVGYPKSGTTWCQEMIWLICNNLDYEKAASIRLSERFRFFELCGLRDLPDHFPTTVSMPSPRFIKTHLPVALLPDQMWTVKPRLIYIRRNLKSVAVSYYHHFVLVRRYKGTMSQFLKSFMKGLNYPSPYHNHVLEYHNLDYHGNILYLCYEDMKKDLKTELKRVSAFFNKAYSDEQLDTLAEHLSFDQMKNNASVNFNAQLEDLLNRTNRADKLNDNNYKFMRKGQLDSWRSELTAEQQQQLDEWTDKKVTDPEQIKWFKNS